MQEIAWRRLCPGKRGSEYPGACITDTSVAAGRRAKPAKCLRSRWQGQDRLEVYLEDAI